VVRLKKTHLIAYVAVGLLTGLLYVGFDVMSEAKLESGTLTGLQARVHALVDHFTPVLIGAFLGLCLYHLHLRARLSAAEEAASRAEALRVRLHKVERDQAVWVLAAAVLHELNNPLHALGLLLDEYPECESDGERRADIVERARGQAARALSHLRALRSMRTMGEPEVEPVSLDGILSKLAEDVSSLAEADGIVVEVECREPVVACADPIYVRTILESLVDNSLQSLRTASGGSLSIRLEKNEARAVVRIQDDGPPLDPAIRAVLFDPLRSTKTQGLGLGLPIARALARSMHGELALDDAEQKAFRLELPLRVSP
jgi:signal transduction histidine kinase